jgi:DNA mismatch repair protein MutS
VNTEKIDRSDKRFQTPMMQQYMELKQKHQDCLLLFRLGDFFELFLDDAKIASQILDITLTARSRGKDGKIPMAGVPHHAVSSYIAKLIQAGYKVAICDQVSEPSAGNLVEREVVRIITPGTALDELSLDARSSNYLLALDEQRTKIGIVLLELSTGEIRADEQKITSDEERTQFYISLISRFQPAELLVSPNNQHLLSIFKKINPILFSSAADDWPSSSTTIKKQLKEHFSVGSLKALGLDNKPLACKTLAGALTYVIATQQQPLHHLRTVQPLDLEKYLQLDPSTITNLELLPTHKSKQHSLLELLDATNTAGGSRLLKKWLLQPLQHKKEIDARLESVSNFLQWNEFRVFHEQFAELADIERLLARFAANTGNPKQLIALARSITQAHRLSNDFDVSETKLLKKHLKNFTISKLQKLSQKIQDTIIDEPPIDPKQSGYIKQGNDKELDKLMEAITTNRSWMANLEKEQREQTGISSLKVRFNKVFGYYIEVSKSNLDKVPESYVRKQTLVNAERFITEEMKEREDVILTAEEKAIAHCHRIFTKLVAEVIAHAAELQQLAQSVAVVDCLLSFATNAEQMQLTQPTITTDTKLEIVQGRHLLVDQLLESGSFVPNDTLLDTAKNQVMLITGPNMAGKSVYMRQVALIVLLAQMGSFVPAQQATIGIVDRIFVRSGAGDNISQGLSTFMVEMVETAFILHHMTSKSLVIMDEIGRGTSTYDGISIAWAIASYLVTNQNPKTLFATHYHELQSLAEEFADSISNYHMAVAGETDKPVFLYTLKAGGASSSFGIAVGRLAGLPDEVTDQASTYLAQLEAGHPHHEPQQPPLLEIDQPTNNRKSDIEAKIKSLALEQTTPLEALNILATLQKKLRQ